MLDGSYTPSPARVALTRGPGEVAEYAEAWAAGLTGENCFVARCGDTFLLIAPERGGAAGRWQVVWDRVETWSEALAIWSRLKDMPGLVRVRALPSKRLKGLNGAIVGAAKAAWRGRVGGLRPATNGPSSERKRGRADNGIASTATGTATD